jgi:DnaJ-class molecular chaperone
VLSLHLRRPETQSEATGVTPEEPSGPSRLDHDINPPLQLQVSLLAPGSGYVKPAPRWHFWEQGLTLGRLTPVHIELERTCSGCGGEAYVPVAVSEVCSECTGDGREVIDGREQACSVCDGRCWVQREVMEQCESCDGTGLELTQAGRRLLRFYGLQFQAFLERWSGWTRIAGSIPVGGGR